jgi:hypothetical protein
MKIWERDGEKVHGSRARPFTTVDKAKAIHQVSTVCLPAFLLQPCCWRLRSHC